MQFNLIDEKWIPVRRRDGTHDTIRPWEVTDGFDVNPIVSLEAPRPDFNGALIQFLIGLVQTTFAPRNKIEWREKLQAPPTPNELKASFMKVRHAFELAGEGPRFMQDFEVIDAEPKSIDFILIETPGNKTREDNTDHFVKRSSLGSSMCPSCCAAALFTMQTNSPAGGSGYRTSLRGGGPLTTLIIGGEHFDTLWHTLWPNILDSRAFLSMCNSRKNKNADLFPWFAPTRSKATEQDIHPAQYFWAMPRRIRLTFHGLASGLCGVCNSNSERLIDTYREVNKGTEYQAPMKHPLSAFNGHTQKAVLTQRGGVSYRHWLGLVANDPEGKREPSRTVHEFIEERQQPDWQFRLWAFGYDMDNMKARCWYEATMPLMLVDRSIRDDFERDISNVVSAASEIASNARSAVKKAWFRRPGDNKGDTSFVTSTFWHDTETAFYQTLHKVKAARESDNDVAEIRKTWHKILCDEGLRIFDANAWNGPIEDADPKRVVSARNELQIYNHSKKIKELLGMSVEKTLSGKRKSKKS